MNRDALPGTPDFARYEVARRILRAETEGQALRLTWSDGRESLHHAFWLRENSCDPATLHPKTRELAIDPCSIPADIRPLTAEIEPSGALSITWSNDATVSRYHPGWLYAHAWFGETPERPASRLWRTEDLEEPPTLDGPAALEEPEVLLAWLISLRTWGIARLAGLPSEDGLLEKVVTRIGPVRETNFGRSYSLFIKPNPDSNAFTSQALLPHMDMPTRECPHGLQFFFCRDNSVVGGEGLFVDGYRIARDLRAEEPEVFAALSEIVWTFNNRAEDSDYRAEGPIFKLDAAGEVEEVRFTPWLRAPLKAPLAVQERAYGSVRRLIARSCDPRYQLVVAYRPGDLVAFDNRRILHGRRAYEANGGVRFIEGIYADRDDLHARIRVLSRGLEGEPSS